MLIGGGHLTLILTVVYRTHGCILLVYTIFICKNVYILVKYDAILVDGICKMYIFLVIKYRVYNV